MAWIFLGIGLVLVIEGLAFALMPDRLEEVLDALRSMPRETRRLLGLTAVTAGLLLVWLARYLGVWGWISTPFN